MIKEAMSANVAEVEREQRLDEERSEEELLRERERLLAKKRVIEERARNR